MTHRHAFLGSAVLSDRPLPELAEVPSPGHGAPVVSVRFEEAATAPDVARGLDLSPWPEDDGPVLRARAGDLVLFRVPDLADFRVRAEALEVECHARPGASPHDVRHFLLNQVLPRLLGHRSPVVLHASALRTDRGAIALAGPSGSGKSTLAASFDASGEGNLLADDAVRVADDGAGATLAGAYEKLRLLPDSLAALRPEERKRRTADRRKVTVPGHAGRNAARGTATPLVAVCVLREADPGTTAIDLVELKGARALLALFRHSFFLDPRDEPAIARHAGAAAALLRAGCRVFSLAYPRRYELLPRVRRTLVDTLGNPALEAGGLLPPRAAAARAVADGLRLPSG